MSTPERGEDEAARPIITLRLRDQNLRQQEDDEQIGDHETPAREEQQRLSPSLEPHKCATAPEICAWAGSPDFLQELISLHLMIRKNKEGVQHAERVRKFACINRAFTNAWYMVPLDRKYQMPAGATGEKRKSPELARGSQGLKRIRDPDVPADEDVYVPKGVSRKLRNRPIDGRWYYPSPSPLSQEFKPE